MPDWLTHSLIGWITGKITKQEIALVVIGALIPDLVKINLAFSWLGIYDYQLFEPLHTPIGAIIIAGIITLFFNDARKAFITLILGISTHFILDLFLIHVYGGMKFLFPFSWEGWQIYLIRSDDYRMTLIALFVALIVFMIYRTKVQHKKQKTHS